VAQEPKKDRIGWPYWLVLAGAAAGVAVALTGPQVWHGAVVMGAAILLGALIRLVVAKPGDLAIRTKALDVLTLGGLGGALVLSGALMVMF